MQVGRGGGTEGAALKEEMNITAAARHLCTWQHSTPPTPTLLMAWGHRRLQGRITPKTACIQGAVSTARSKTRCPHDNQAEVCGLTASITGDKDVVVHELHPPSKVTRAHSKQHMGTILGFLKVGA